MVACLFLFDAKAQFLLLEILGNLSYKIWCCLGCPTLWVLHSILKIVFSRLCLVGAQLQQAENHRIQRITESL